MSEDKPVQEQKLLDINLDLLRLVGEGQIPKEWFPGKPGPDLWTFLTVPIDQWPPCMEHLKKHFEVIKNEDC